MTWEEIRKRFLEELVRAEKKLDEDISAFARRFIKKLKAEGYRITPELEQELNNYVRGHEDFLRRLIKLSAAEVAIGRGISGPMRDDFVAQIAEEVFRRRWADGKNLSERIWWINDEIRRGMTETLAQGIRTGASVNRVVYEIQYEIERATAARFMQVTTERLPKWVKDLWEAARAMIKTPEARKAWEETIKLVEEHLRNLSREGTYYASKRLLNEIRRAVELGREELINKALNWWLYDRQLYFIKRVARTEAANAFHLAQIRATEDDPDVIGYQWRLSRSHPRPDICDWYANVDFGLGKGVWPKDRVPRGKAHPHCMCYLLPRVTKSKIRGVRSFRELWEQLPEGQRREMLPRWASKLAHAGVSPDEFLLSDGLTFRRRKDFIARLGKNRFEALSAIGGALEEVKWRELKIKPSARMTRETIKALERYRDRPEVRRILRKIKAGDPINSRDWHCLKRKYEDDETWLKRPEDLDRIFDRVLKDKEALVFRPGERIVVFSEKLKWYAIVEKDGTRVTTYRARSSKWPENLQGKISDLLKSATEAAS